MTVCAFLTAVISRLFCGELLVMALLEQPGDNRLQSYAPSIIFPLLRVYFFKSSTEMAELSLATVKDIERGKANPSFDTVSRIMDVLGMEIVYRVRRTIAEEL